MTRARRTSPHHHIPDEVYTELVDMLFRAMTALINMAVVVTGIGALMFAMTDDPLVGALTLAALAVTTFRIGLNLGYRRRNAGAPMPLPHVKQWELAFGAGAIMAGLSSSSSAASASTCWRRR